MIYIFKPKHIVYLLGIIITIVTFTTGYGSGEFLCNDTIYTIVVSCVRFILTIIFAFAAVLGLVGSAMIMMESDYKKEIHIKLPKLFKSSGFGLEHPNWNDFQEFLKEKDKI